MSKVTKQAAPADGMRALIARARKGDRSTLPEVRRILSDPHEVDALGGDLALQAEASFVQALAGKDLVLTEALPRKLDALRAELAGPNPTPVERLLVERVVACWLQVQDAEVRFAQGQGNLSIKQADYYQRRMDGANRRYLAALKALAVARKLALPVLQINVARKQVNLAAPAAVSTGGSG